VLHITTPKNNKFLYDPTKTIATPKTRFIKLNKVNVFSINICLTLLLGVVVS